MERAFERTYYYCDDELSDTLCLPVNGTRSITISLPELTHNLLVASGSLRGRSANFPSLNLESCAHWHYEDVLQGNRVYRQPRNKTTLQPGSSQEGAMSAQADENAFTPVFVMPSQSVARRAFKTISGVLFSAALIASVFVAFQMSGS